jgi:hypothetical protein
MRVEERPSEKSRNSSPREIMSIGIAKITDGEEIPFGVQRTECCFNALTGNCMMKLQSY